jgi:hypothetical protein
VAILALRSASAAPGGRVSRYATIASMPKMAIVKTTTMMTAIDVDMAGIFSNTPCLSKKVMLIAIIDTRAASLSGKRVYGY